MTALQNGSHLRSFLSPGTHRLVPLASPKEKHETLVVLSTKKIQFQFTWFYKNFVEKKILKYYEKSISFTFIIINRLCALPWVKY